MSAERIAESVAPTEFLYQRLLAGRAEVKQAGEWVTNLEKALEVRTGHGYVIGPKCLCGWRMYSSSEFPTPEEHEAVRAHVEQMWSESAAVGAAQKTKETRSES